ncbi:MAG TPA: DUF3237 domain-containing protein [Acidimicrobiales bacterium]|jgi:hypothetical protein|nr:DUF3237 domain-containing protein [Acidimicrobiales bacterium]
MELVHEFDFYATLKPPVAFGARMFFEIVEGKVTGERVSGHLLSGGGDWVVMGADGWGHLDVRAQIATDDGASIYAHYTGLLEMTEKVMAATSTGEPTDFADQYFRTTPRFETGDERYAWMNHTLFAAEGRMSPGGGVEYRVHRIT